MNLSIMDDVGLHPLREASYCDYWYTEGDKR
jgi:hypothetical protein